MVESGSASAGWAPVPKYQVAAQMPPPTRRRAAIAPPAIRAGFLPLPPERGWEAGATREPPPCTRYSGPCGPPGGNVLDMEYPLVIAAGFQPPARCVPGVSLPAEEPGQGRVAWCRES